MNQVIQTIKSRRSIRHYKEEQIKQQELDAIIEAGIYAPSAGNDQSWHFTVVQNKELLEHINQITRELMIVSNIKFVREMGNKPNFYVTYHAPTLIIVSGRGDAFAWETDCAAAIENMLIAAQSLGIGSVWLGLLRQYLKLEDEIKKFKIPKGYKPFYGFVLGYPEGNIPAAPERERDVVNYII
jgi:nitroreductase